MSKIKKLKKRLAVLEHVVGKLIQGEIQSSQRLTDLEEICYDEVDLTQTVENLKPVFMLNGPFGQHGSN